jgi:hypothetical protein
VVVTEAPGRHRSRRVPIAIGAVVVALLVVAGGVQLLRPPDAFGPAGNVEGSSRGQVGVPYVVGVAFPTGSADVVAARPVFAPDSAAAVVSLQTCHQVGPGDRIGTGDLDSLQRCDALEPLAGSHLDHHRPEALDTDEVVAVVTPREPGLVRITGIDVTSRRGWLHRTERTGAAIELTVR